MVEQKVAMNLVKKALDGFNKTLKSDFPALSISKRYYKRYNLDILTNELNRLNFKCIEQINAPEPYKSDKNASKYWLIYQPVEKNKNNI